MNPARRHFEGPRAKVFWAWAAFVRTMKFVLFFHENVLGFGCKEFKLHLPMYDVVRIEVDPSREGWATYRKRQIIFAILLCWAHGVLGDVSDAELKNHFDLQQAYEHFFRPRVQVHVA